MCPISSHSFFRGGKTQHHRRRFSTLTKDTTCTFSFSRDACHLAIRLRPHWRSLVGPSIHHDEACFPTFPSTSPSGIRTERHTTAADFRGARCSLGRRHPKRRGAVGMVRRHHTQPSNLPKPLQLAPQLPNSAHSTPNSPFARNSVQRKHPIAQGGLNKPTNCPMGKQSAKIFVGSPSNRRRVQGF